MVEFYQPCVFLDVLEGQLNKTNLPARPVSNLACFYRSVTKIRPFWQRKTTSTISRRQICFSEATGSDFRHGQSARRVLEESVGFARFFDVGSLKKGDNNEGTHVTIRSFTDDPKLRCWFLFFEFEFQVVFMKKKELKRFTAKLDNLLKLWIRWPLVLF